MVLVSSGTHLVKDHESLSPKRSPKLEMLGPLCNQQLIRRQTPNLFITAGLLKLKYSLSIYLKHKKD